MTIRLRTQQHAGASYNTQLIPLPFDDNPGDRPDQMSDNERPLWCGRRGPLTWFCSCTLLVLFLFVVFLCFALLFTMEVRLHGREYPLPGMLLKDTPTVFLLV